MPEETAFRTPKVSVLMITYNHEQYIEQAVRSVSCRRPILTSSW